MSLNISFTKSEKLGFTYWSVDSEFVLNIMITNSNDFKKSPSIQSFIQYLSKLRFGKIKVLWIGLTPDIELTHFLDDFHTDETVVLGSNDNNDHRQYPDVFNPFGSIANVDSNITRVNRTPSNTPSISSTTNTPNTSNMFKTDIKTLKTHIQTYPAHPNFQDTSAKNMPKIINYIKATLGKNMTREYLDSLCTELITFANENQI